MNQQALAQLIREWFKAAGQTSGSNYVHHDNDTETTIDGIFSLFELASYPEQRIKAPAEGQKFDTFMSELARLCVAHGVKISPSRYDGLQVWDATDGDEPVHFNGIEDCTKPNVGIELTAQAGANANNTNHC